ncbi:MAG: hypothetical protein IV107_16590 [Paucibacter sp.]|nr:hypothetical protein [Roseateles sp.]
MKRSGFASKAIERRPAKQIEYTPRPRAVAQALVIAAPRALVAIPKGPACKPGKRTPTAAEKAWMDAITAMGCIACIVDGHPETPGAVHHILSGGRRMGHMHTICLCDPGHHQGGQQLGKVSRHPFKVRFEGQYGSESDLLDLTQQLVGTEASRARANSLAKAA